MTCYACVHSLVEEQVEKLGNDQEKIKKQYFRDKELIKPHLEPGECAVFCLWSHLVIAGESVCADVEIVNE